MYPLICLYYSWDKTWHGVFGPAHPSYGARAGILPWLEDGRPLAWLHRVTGPAASLDGAHFPYAISHVRVEHTEADPGVPTGAWRSVAHPQSTFAIEGFVDEMATAAGADPPRARHRRASVLRLLGSAGGGSLRRRGRPGAGAPHRLRRRLRPGGQSQCGGGADGRGRSFRPQRRPQERDHLAMAAYCKATSTTFPFCEWTKCPWSRCTSYSSAPKPCGRHREAAMTLAPAPAAPALRARVRARRTAPRRGS